MLNPESEGRPALADGPVGMENPPDPCVVVVENPKTYKVRCACGHEPLVVSAVSLSSEEIESRRVVYAARPCPKCLRAKEGI